MAVNSSRIVTVTDNVKITNYKPAENRKALKTDINITNDENKEVVIPENYTALVAELKTLDGDKSSLSPKDLELAKKLAGNYNISKVLNDKNVTRFEFYDGTEFRIDMNVDNKPAIKKIKEEIASKNAKYESGFLHYMSQVLTPHNSSTGPEIVLNKLPDGVVTLGDVKRYYNLPDGCLRNNVIKGGGDFDTYEAPVPLFIHVNTMAAGLGVAPEQIEALFNGF